MFCAMWTSNAELQCHENVCHAESGASNEDGDAANGDHAAEEAGDAALEHLQTMVALIETYFHPSNSGSCVLSTQIDRVSTRALRFVAVRLSLSATSIRSRFEGDWQGHIAAQDDRSADTPCQVSACHQMCTATFLWWPLHLIQFSYPLSLPAAVDNDLQVCQTSRPPPALS